MWFFRADKPKNHRFDDPEEYYRVITTALKEKADHNKNESQGIFFTIIVFTLLAPLFVTLGEGSFFGKVIPASLSVCAACATMWLQVRKPHRLWAIYRRAQRELERDKALHDFGLGEFHGVEDKGKLLASKVAQIAFNVHEQWESVVPEPEALVSINPLVRKVEEGSESAT